MNSIDILIGMVIGLLLSYLFRNMRENFEVNPVLPQQIVQYITSGGNDYIQYIQILNTNGNTSVKLVLKSTFDAFLAQGKSLTEQIVKDNM